MRIEISGKGIHRREVPGIEKLRELPSDWYAFANRELIERGAMPRQIDIIMVLDDRIIIADIKDWHGNISSDGDRWFRNGRSVDTSPVKKILENSRILKGLLSGYLQKIATKSGQKFNHREIPLIEGCVILTGRCTIDDVPEGEKPRIFLVDEFCRVIRNRRDRNRHFVEPKWIDAADPFTAQNSKWRSRLASFFDASKGYFRPLDKQYGDYRAVSDATYTHPKHLYSEYDCEENAASRSFGLLRLWDFSKANPRYASEEGRSEIADRERTVIAYLVDRQPELEAVLLRLKTADPDKGIHYWEVFERRRQLVRLADFVKGRLSELTSAAKLDLVRTLLSHASAIHRLGAAHLDFGLHSIWIEAPSRLRLSHLLAAAYPELRTLGDRRFEFLANGAPVPEDILGGAIDHLRKDVFLLATVAHTLIFGQPPRPHKADDPPEWDAGVDQENRFSAIHDWFAKGLNLAPEHRFATAEEMLDGFNAAGKPIAGDSAALERLQRFRKWKSLIDVYQAYQIAEILRQTDRIEAWRSESQGKSVIVKIWRRCNWEDERLEAPRLLRFCETAEDLLRSEPPGIAPIVDVGYVGDHLILIQERIDAPNLAEDLAADTKTWANSKVALSFIRRLADLISGFHDRGRAHGDLKPSNLLVRNCNEGKEPILVDVVDFAPAEEGEIQTSAYAPAYGAGAVERDRYAVLKITEEVLSKSDLDATARQHLANAITTCRDEVPRLATLIPLTGALDQALNPPPAVVRKALRLRLVGVTPGAIVPDEGRYYVGVHRGRMTITGGSEELNFKLRSDGRILTAQRRRLEQTKVALAEKHAAKLLHDEVVIESAPVADFSALDELLQSSEIVALLRGEPPVLPEEGESEPDDFAEQPIEEVGDVLDEDSVLAEPQLDTAQLPIPVDVPTLWRTLIDVEQEQFTEGVAESDSVYSREQRRHLVPFAGSRGTIDFARDDQVRVEFAHEKRGWVPVGVLDLDLTRSDLLAVDASNYAAGEVGLLCRAGAVLRFRSLMESDSRYRRDSATSRILSRQSEVPNLIDYFDPVRLLDPIAVESSVNAEAICERYGLNHSQGKAFIKVWASRPLGLLQGPPGTGKTKFIGAFVHHALSTGAVRNVLLSSQSHEAVNNAAESVLKLFRQEGEEPSLIRVGQEGNVSDLLKPYHSEKVEAHYREQFRARLKQRFRVAAQQIGLSEAFADDLYFLESTVWPIFSHLQSLKAHQISGSMLESADIQRLRRGLLETLSRLNRDIRIGSPSLDWESEAAYDSAIEILAKRRGIETPDHVRRFRAVAALARDWMGSVSSRGRSFEEFLANTRQIVCGTCVGLGRSTLGLLSARFDLVVIDEAARCTPSELAVPMQAGRWVVLVGDHLQLEPFHKPEVLRETQRRTAIPLREVARSDFERAFSSKYGRKAGETLKTQYRMLPSIGDLVSHVFYQASGGLEHGRSEPKVPLECLPEPLKSQILWLQTDKLREQGFQSRPPDSETSLCNQAEANSVVDILRLLDQHQPFLAWLGTQTDQRPIGIICTYAKQVDLIRRTLDRVSISGALRNACKIDTIDSYQGKENMIVILSLVRNNADGPVEFGRRTIAQGFMSRGNRINVGLSRAMDLLIVVGALERWPAESPMARVASMVSRLADKGAAQLLQAHEFAVYRDDADLGRSRNKRASKTTPSEEAR